MTKPFRSALFVFMLGVATIVHALPPAIEADRQMFTAKSAMDAQDWERAIKAFEAAEATGVKKFPESFDYQFALALKGAGQYEKAQVRVQKYLEERNTKGRYYAQSIELLTTIDRLISEQTAARQAREREAQAEADRRDRERRRAAARQREIDAAWDERELSGQGGKNQGQSSYCAELQDELRGRGKAVRNIQSCRCKLDNHPAYVNDYWPLCRVTYEENAVLIKEQ